MTPSAQNSHSALEILSGQYKLTIDLMKHLMSLSVGTIVVVATFHDRITKNAHMAWTLPLSIICLLLCVLFAMRVCFDLTYSAGHITSIRALGLIGNPTDEQLQSIKKGQAQSEKREKELSRYLMGSNLTFATGVVAIAIFVLRNFFT